MTERLHFHFSLSCTGEGNGNPLQCSCLKNPRDGGAWWAAVSGVAQSWTRLKWLSSIHMHIFNKLQSICISNNSMTLQPEGLEYGNWLMHKKVRCLFSDHRDVFPSHPTSLSDSCKQDQYWGFPKLLSEEEINAVQQNVQCTLKLSLYEIHIYVCVYTPLYIIQCYTFVCIYLPWCHKA